MFDWIGLIARLRFEFHVSFFFSTYINNNCTVHAHEFTMQETKYIVHALFMGLTTTLFRKKEKKLKIGSTALFTLLKIIFLQCFQFLVFNFQQNKLYLNRPSVPIWIGLIARLHFEFHVSFSFFLFFSTHMNSNCIVHAHGFTVQETKYTVHAPFTYCSWDPQPLYAEKIFKNGSHGTIHTFKNYFVTVFLIFSFQQNNLYPNEPLFFKKYFRFYREK